MNILQVNDADDAIRMVRNLNRRIFTFSGFSSKGYEDQAAVERLMCEELDKLDPAADIVCSGATQVGIGAVYALASSRGFETIGIVSTNAQKERVRFADDVVVVYVIQDDTWGGYIDNNETPSPTSRVMVEASDELVFIGGDDIARDEYRYAEKCQKPARFFPADMNHAIATENAQRKGRPTPTDFRGTLALYGDVVKK